jgi:7-carboxy-7-deazaguanine synthase
MLKVSEIFLSIQGESSFAGLPCAFVRLAGCNLRCKYCDTAHSFKKGKPYSVQKTISLIREFDCPLVEIAGGEPLIQEETPLLSQALLDEGFRVLMETNGTKNIDLIKGTVTRIMDIKTPGSGESDKTDWRNINRLDKNDEVKFVLTSRADYDWAKNIVRQYGLDQKVPLLFSPAHDHLEPAELSRWILEDRINVRLQLQIHKVIWPNEEKGK